MTINLDKKTKVMLAVAGVAVVGLYLMSRGGKKSLTGLQLGSSPSTGVSTGYWFGSAWIPPGAGTPFQSNTGNWFYCPSGNQRVCDQDLVYITPTQPKNF